jgi:TPR repeat protein
MQNEQITDCLAEIESLEKQIGQFVNQLEEINKSLSEKNSALEQQKNERDGLENSIKALGFFKFKERKLLKEDLAMINAKIEESSKTISELENEMQKIQQKKDSLQKEKELKKLAGQGNSQAQFDLAKVYAEQTNLSQAAHWFEQAAKQGHMGAQYELAVIFYNGLIAERDNAKALFWSKKSSEQGHDGAKKLTSQIEEEEEKRRKQEEMINLASKGDPQAQHALATSYCKGVEFEKDYTKAIYWYKEASVRGHKEAEKLAAQLERIMSASYDITLW